MNGLTRVDYHDGNYVSYSYDNACRLTRVVDRNGYKPEDLPFTGNGMSGGIKW